MRTQKILAVARSESLLVGNYKGVKVKSQAKSLFVLIMHRLQFHQLLISVPDVLGIACGVPESVRYFALFYEDAATWVDAGWVRLECDYWNVFVPLIEHRITRLQLLEVDAEIGEGSINSHALLIDQQGSIYVGLKQEVREAVQQMNPIPSDPNAVMLHFIEEHYADIPPCLKALAHGKENLLMQSNTKIKELITQHLDRKPNSPPRDISQIDCHKLLHALRTEAKTNFLDWSDEQQRFSEVLLTELCHMPDGLPEDLRIQWREIELKFRTYASQSSSQRQEIANRAHKLLHKLPFLQKLHLHKQSRGTHQLDFVGMDLREINAQGLSLKGANFSKADLRKAYFRGANLRGADFSGADLTGAIFTQANLSQAVFRDADLSNVIFDGADVTGVNFADVMGSCGIPESGYYEHPRS